MAFSVDEYRAALKASRWPPHIEALRQQIREDQGLNLQERAELLKLADKREGKIRK